MFYKKVALKNFEKFTRKYQHGVTFSKVTGFGQQVYLNKDSTAVVYSWILQKIAE